MAKNREEPKIKNTPGRPTMYTDDLANEICHKISTTPFGLKRLCSDNPHWPERETIFAWKRQNDTFSHMYMKAKMDQVEALTDECLDISDDISNDNIVKVNEKTGEEYVVCNSEYVNRSRLRVDTRKWLASKLAPRIYGDKQELNVDVTARQEDSIDRLK